MAKIERVSYRRVKSIASYETETIELEAQVMPNETAQEALDDLQTEALIWLYPDKYERG